MTFKLLTKQYFEFLSFNGSSTGSSESTLVKMPHCWKSRVAAQLSYDFLYHKNKECNGEVIFSEIKTNKLI